ncbi:MAG: c-type cytochrome [Pirellulaceae bacterium]|nr:hypothetical protein [Planctomycetales bacterium]
MKGHVVTIGLLLRIVTMVILAEALAGGQIQPATDRPLPKSPKDSLACMQFPPDISVSLVAAEPMVRDPSAICFDEQGRLWVSEIHGYNLDGYFDIVDLNKSGELDREVRRVRFATAASQEAAQRETYGTVRMLEDSDGDGRIDRAVVWADHLPPCYGLIAARGGMIAVGAPDIVFLADRDGDNRAEVREILFTGFQRELIERGINNPRWGVDNWIYVAAGGGGGDISGPGLQNHVAIGHTDFRFRPDGSAIEPVTGRESMFGLTLNDVGDRFHTIVTQVVPLPDRYLRRNPWMVSPAGDRGLIPYRRIFPISQPDPWRLKRGIDPAWVKFYGEGETKPNGNFTSSSGQLIYSDALLPSRYRDNYFVCDPANNLIHRCLLERQGASYSVRRADGEEDAEFLASTDQWFRPINLIPGPDGAIYVVDMYREIIEDFSAIPRFLQQQYADSLVAGVDHGRIWRLSRVATANDAESKVDPPTFRSAASTVAANDLASLIAGLQSDTSWIRQQSQRLLVERRDPACADDVRKVAQRGELPASRLQALYVLDALQQLRPDDIVQALSDTDWGVRMHALRLCEPWLAPRADMCDHVCRMVDDPEARVRLQLALTLGTCRSNEGDLDSRAYDALVHMATQYGHELWMDTAIVSSASASPARLIVSLTGHPTVGEPVRNVTTQLAEVVGARHQAPELAACLNHWIELRADDANPRLPDDEATALLDALVRGAERSANEFKDVDDQFATSIGRLLQAAHGQFAPQALQLAARCRLNESAILHDAWQAAGDAAHDVTQPLERRLRAVALLATSPARYRRPLIELLHPSQPSELQLAVLTAFAAAHDELPTVKIVDKCIVSGPKVQAAMVDLCFQSPEGLAVLLRAVEEERLPLAAVSALRREQLREHADERIRQRARKLLSVGENDTRMEVVNRFEAALALARDPARGREVFRKTCSRCHRLEDYGYRVGPDLTTARTRADATLLVDIFNPSSSLAQGFTVASVTTVDGRIHTGLLANDGATSVTLLDGGKQVGDAPMERSVLRKEIEELRVLSKSLMPDGLEQELNAQDVADLIGYLRQATGPVLETRRVLFDDEQSFVDALQQGGATATLQNRDVQSGEVALRLTEGQRYSTQLPGWAFEIVEHPEREQVEGSATARQYRYLRIAWKAEDAKGVMIELADDGHWPEATQAARRYVAGENSSGWNAISVAETAPREWAMLTVDLWSDCGSFVLTGIAPTALQGTAMFDRIELLKTLP